MQSLSLSTNDLCYHVVTFGMDIYPPVEIPDERTRLNMFFEEARARWDRLFGRLVASDTEFRISAELRHQPEVAGPSYPVETFLLTPRGPVCVFPLVLPDPVGTTGLEDTYLEDFDGLQRLFFRAVPERLVMRIGLVRDLIFETGQTPCEAFIPVQASFAGARLAGGQLAFKYQDERHNHKLRVEPVALSRTTQLPIGTTVTEPAGYGVKVRLDVNNSDVKKPLDESEIQAVLDRATNLWPEKLLEYLHDLRGGRL